MQALSAIERAELAALVKTFNARLADGALSRGFDFLDVHALTDRGDGCANGDWHIDEYPLTPAAMEKAWAVYPRRATTS